MRQLGALILLFSVTVPAFAAEPPTEETPSIPWYRRVFLGERTPPPKPMPVVKAASPVSREVINKMLVEESAVYLKRLESITKIKQIALDRNDDALLKKAEELERQAEETHNQRCEKLRGVDVLDDDRKSLERRPDDRPATADRSTRRPTRGDQ